MKGLARIAAFSGICLALGPATVNGRAQLAMRVSPTVVMAPGFVTVSVTVEADADNRFLEVVAESPDFFRSSQVPLDGANAPRLSVFEFKSLPIGLYQVTSRLVGNKGQRAVAIGLLKVDTVGSR